MTKGIFPLIPLSHKGSTGERERGCTMCVKGCGLSPPEGMESYMALLPRGPYSEAWCMEVKEEYRLLLKQESKSTFL